MTKSTAGQYQLDPDGHVENATTFVLTITCCQEICNQPTQRSIPLADQCYYGKNFGSLEHWLALNFIFNVWNSLPVDIVNFGHPPLC